MGMFKSAWLGEARLWKVFWILGVVLPVGVGLLAAVFVLSVILAPVAIVLWIALFIYTILWWRMMWRCSFNVNWRGWGYVGRVLVVLSVLYTAKSIYDIATDEGALLEMLGETETAVESLDVPTETGEVMIIRPGTSDTPIQAPPIKEEIPVSVSSQLPGSYVPAAALPHTEKCKEKFAVEYRAAGFNPADYPDKEAEYIKICVDYLQKAAQ